MSPPKKVEISRFKNGICGLDVTLNPQKQLSPEACILQNFRTDDLSAWLFATSSLTAVPVRIELDPRDLPNKF